MKKVFGLLVGIMIGFCGLVFSACDLNYDNVNLVPSTQKLEMVVNEETSFSLEMENFISGMSADVQFNNVNDLFTIVDKEINGNKVFFKVKAQKTGTTKVEIVSLEGNRTCNLDVEVYQDIESFTLKNQPYVVKKSGNSYVLSEQSYFNFLPSGAKTSEILFKYDNNIINEIRVVANESNEPEVILISELQEELKITQSEFRMTASLVDYPTLPSQEISFKVIEPIDVGDLKIIKKGAFDTTQYLVEPIIVEKNSVVNLISNSTDSSYFEFELQCLTDNVEMQISSTLTECVEMTEDEYASITPASEFSKFFKVQAKSAETIGDDTITISLYYPDSSYFKENFTFTISVATAPYSINANNMTLYDNAVELYDYNFNGDLTYLMSINVLDQVSKFESVTFSIVKKDLISGTYTVLNDYSEYVQVDYKLGVQNSTFDIPYSDFANNTLIEDLKIKGQETGVYDESKYQFYFRLTVNSEILGTKTVSTEIPFVVKSGANSLSVENKYANGITLNLAEGEKLFNGFVINNEATAYIGAYTITYLDNCENLFTITQNKDTNDKYVKSITITPLQVGSGTVKIKLPNGLVCTLPITVSQELDSASFSISRSDFLDIQEDKVYAAYLGLKNDIQQMMVNIIPEPRDATLFTVLPNITDTSVLKISSNELTSVVVDILKTSETASTLTITIYPSKIVDFAVVADTESVLTFTIDVYSYSPITSVEFISNGNSVENISIYRSSDVGYFDQAKATASCTIKVTRKDGSIVENVYDYFGDNYTKTTQLGALGYDSTYDCYYIERFYVIVDEDIDNNTLTFTGGDESKKKYATLGSVWFSISVTEHGETITKQLNITIDEYTPLEYVGITNYTESLYLSGTQSSYTFYTYLDPNADCQSFYVKFIPDENQPADLFNITIKNNSEVTIIHNPNKQGKGYLYFIPQTKLNANGTFDTTKMQKIAVSYSDGTDENNPEVISSADEFIQAMSSVATASKHYLILSTLDFSGKDVSTFQPLTGTITGGNATAKLTNITINKVNADSNYVGLFPSIASSGKISNLIIEGKINVSISNLDDDKFIGLVAGENLGTMQNVSVVLNTSNVSVEDSLTTSSYKLYVGGMFGVNGGNVQTNYNSEEGTFNHTQISSNGTLTVSYKGYSTYTAVGGIAGSNSGTISRTNFTPSVYNSDIYTVNIKLQTEGTNATGGVVGINETSGKVSGQLVAGTISAQRKTVALDENRGGINAGGIAGKNSGEISSSTIRLQIRAYDYAGGICGVENNASGVQNNKVQSAKTASISPMLCVVLGSNAHVGAFCGNENESVNETYSTNQNYATYYYTLNETTKTYPIVYNYMNNVYQSYKLSAFQQGVASINITSISESDGTYKFDVVPTGFENKVVNMFIYTALNADNQKFVENKNTNRELPFVFENPDAIIVTSLSTDILSIDASGKISIYKTGLAKIQVLSLLDTTLTTTVYVYVTNAFNHFYLQVSDSETIINQAEVKVYTYAPVDLNCYFANEAVSASGTSGETISVELVKCELPYLSYTYYVYDTNSIRLANNDEKYTTLSLNGSLFVFSTNDSLLSSGTTHENIVKFIPTYKFNLTGIGEVQISNMTFLNNEKCTNEITVVAKRGTSKIQLDVSDVTLEPMNQLKVVVNQITDDSTDTLTITSYKDGSENTDFFITTDNQTVYNYAESRTITLQFNYEKYGMTDYVGTYYITFTAVNGTSQTITVNLKQQQIINISTKSFFDVKEYNPTDAQNTNLASGVYNILEINVYPYFANYDYILVTPDQTNLEKSNKLIMEVVTYDAVNKKFIVLDGVKYTDDGIIIDKEILFQEDLRITSSVSRVLIRYTTISSATIDSTAKLWIYAMQENDSVSESIYDTYVIFNIIAKDSVYFTINAREISQTNEYYLAKGVDYDLTLHINGFTENQMVTEIYDKSGNMIFDSTKTETQNASSVVKISKENAGYVLSVAKSVTYGGEDGYYAKIVTYGTSVIDGVNYSSGTAVMEVYIEDFVIVTDNMASYTYSTTDITDFDKNIAVGGTTHAVANLSVGNTFNLSAKFTQNVTVEYDETNIAVNKAVLAFENALTNTDDAWKVYATENNILGKFVKEFDIGEENLQSDYLRINGLKVIPLKINDYESTKYYFHFTNYFAYIDGAPQVVASSYSDKIDLSSDFIFNVYPNSSLENAIPVYTYEEFANMKEDSHYILMGNISLPNNFTPIETEIASLDGNGYSIIYPEYASFDEGEYFGLFGTVGEDTILKNITIEIDELSNIEIVPADSAYFGILAGANNGIITNCYIKGSKQLAVTYPNQTTTSENNYVAGLVAVNNGYISNSRFEGILASAANVAGFVALNNNKIASSYVRNSQIINKSSSSYHVTAGFVLRNGTSAISDAQICTSYVTGATSTTAIYSTNKQFLIDSTRSAAGFVYTNYGNVQDSYADIYINASSLSSGFVFANGGSVVRCYSTSTTAGGEADYGFIGENMIDSVTYGSFTDCFMLIDGADHSVFSTDAQYEGLTKIDSSQFNKQSVFANFAISSNVNKTEAVWFFPSNSTESTFKNGTSYSRFTYGKPELVAPNIITYSQKELDGQNTTVNETTGETIYAYIETREAVGSLYNPILIYSAQSFETYILSNSLNNVNSNYYRIIGDIDYDNEDVNVSNTYNTIFNGDLEGNGMEIAGFSIDAATKATSGGLFAQIGQSGVSGGVVKNLTLSPKYLNLPNTNCVGTLAGKLESGRVYNIICDGFNADTKGVKIIGFNSVGGVIGLATGNFTMINVQSSVSAQATYDHTKSNVNIASYLSSTDLTKVSYAGTIAGIATNRGTIINVASYDACFAIGEFTGLLFGKIGNGVTLSNVEQNINEEQNIIASAYGGIIIGELSGTLDNVVVSGDIANNFFRKSDKLYGTAIGGLVGLMTNGSIANSKLEGDITLTTLSCGIVGGLVGEMLGGTINNSSFNGTISVTTNASIEGISSLSVGGLVGKISYTPTLIFVNSLSSSNVNIKNSSTTGKINISIVSIKYVYVGGGVGIIQNNYKTENNKTSALNTIIFNNVTTGMKINIVNTIYSGLLSTYVGGIVGAVFADTTNLYGGEIVIYESQTTTKYPSSSNCKIDVQVTSKGKATNKLYFGGIVGFGITTSQMASINAKPTKNNSWGLILKNYYYVNDDDETQNGEGAVNITKPNYLGRSFDEYGKLISMAKTNPAYFTTNIVESNWEENNR